MTLFCTTSRSAKKRHNGRSAASGGWALFRCQHASFEGRLVCKAASLRVRAIDPKGFGRGLMVIFMFASRFPLPASRFRNTRAACNFTSWNLVRLVILLLYSTRLASECTLASIRASRVWKAASGVDPRSLRALASVDGLVPRRERQVLGLLAVVARRSQHHARRRAALAPHHAQHREH